MKADSSYADELIKTARLASIGLENTEANSQAHHTLLVSGAILFEETLYQSTVEGKKMVDVLIDQGIVPGIKVDKLHKDQTLAAIPGRKFDNADDRLKLLETEMVDYVAQSQEM
ncbi:aldolase [Lithospermum erythrorhizon]|uniref:fructose-bisphosphate aldolase n=1 Tax=Lithospermum erythrorhizon TaxID=34254 RepID=A0AAV3QBP4_LITER